MRIAHVLRRLSFDDWGGTEQVVWNIAKAQKAAGHEVRLFATTALWRGNGEPPTPRLWRSSRGTGNGERNRPLWVGATHGEATKPSEASAEGTGNGEREVVDGIEIVRFKPIYPWWPMPKSLVDELDRKGGNPFVPGLGKALRDWQPDVIHCHAMARIAELCLRIGERGTADAKAMAVESGNGLPAEALAKAGERGMACPPKPWRRRGNGERVRCVVSLHGGGANVPGEEAKSLRAPTRGRLPWGKMVDILMGWTRRVPEDFGGIVCVGEDEYLKYKEKHPHVMFLPNGVDTRLFDASSGSRTSSESRPTGQITVLCVARIDRQKNQMMLVEWLARNPGATVRLVGPVTQTDYRAELEARAAELGVSDRLSIVGALRPGSPELLGEYAKADVFVLPSRHEPFGIVVLEAWAAGLPVVASDVGGLGKLCAAHPDAALTFAAGDFDAMDGALRRVASDGDLRTRLSTAGRAAAAEYDWRTLSSRLVDFYAEI